MSNALDKKLWLLDAKEKEILTVMMDQVKSEESKYGEPNEKDIEEIQLNGIRAAAKWREMKPTLSTFPLKSDLLKIASAAIRLLKKID